MELGNTETAARARGGAKPHSRGHRRLLGIERHAVFVAGDASTAERQFRHLAGQTLWPQIDQHEMRIGAAGDDVEASRLERFRQRLGVGDDVAGIKLKGRAQRFAECNRLGGDHMHQRSALEAGKDRSVELFREFLLVGENEARAGAAQRFVRGRGDDVGVRERIGMDPARHQAGKMRHVDQQLGPDLIGDVAEATEIENPRIGRSTSNNHLRPMFVREPFHLVEVDPVIVASHAVRNGFEPAPRHVDGRAMGEMAAGGEVEAHEGVARRHQCHEGGGVRRGARVRLDVCESTSEKLGNAFDGKAFCHIDMLASAVIAPPRQAFRVLIGQN